MESILTVFWFPSLVPLDTDSNQIKIVMQMTCHYVHHNVHHDHNIHWHYVVTGVIHTKENNEKRRVFPRNRTTHNQNPSLGNPGASAETETKYTVCTSSSIFFLILLSILI